ncbi:hypothetical protein ACLMAJ_03210 [Nocardia sp. KC 131]|uniref:hypothetical protein n=1 Tax=Nocardia arseniciresistens TaxID=3392119 RepID=UPI00398F73EA
MPTNSIAVSPSERACPPITATSSAASIATTDSPTGVIVEDPKHVRNLNYLYDNVFAAMPNKQDSLALIEQTARELASRT